MRPASEVAGKIRMPLTTFEESVAMLLARDAEVRAAALEELQDRIEIVAKARCTWCAEGEYPVRPGKVRPDSGEWWHDVGAYQQVCRAADIRALATRSTEEPTK